eukprot:jgi/Botrbrau1/20694/Bobra.0058s0024.2
MYGRTVSTWTARWRPWAFYIISTMLLLAILNKNVVLVSANDRQHGVVKDVNVNAIPWARGRGSERGGGLYWSNCHSFFQNEVQVADTNKAAFDIIFYGDSIIEAWRGTYLGNTWKLFESSPQHWKKAFESKYHAAAFGIAGDGVAHLMFRLIDGELPKVSPRVMVFEIGSADLYGTTCTDTVARRTLHHLEYLLKYVHNVHPTSHIIIMALLPKGEDWPNLCTPAILAVNKGLEAMAARFSKFQFVDLSSRFLKQKFDGRWEVNERHFPDSTNPSSAAMLVITDELEVIIRHILDEKPVEAPATQTVHTPSPQKTLTLLGPPPPKSGSPRAPH